MRFKLAVGVIGCQADQRFSLVRKNKYFSLARGSVAYNFHFIVLCQLIGRDAVIQRHGAGAGYTQFRSEEHTSELQSLMRIPYAVFCLKKKKNNQNHTTTHQNPTIDNIPPAYLIKTSTSYVT